VTEWLSDEWAEGLAGAVGRLPGAGPVSGTVSLAVAKAPRKEVAVHWAYEDGSVAAAASGPLADADLVLTMTGADAATVLSGDVEPSVAFMRGRLKASGDGRLLLAFLRSTTEPSFADFLDRVADEGLLGRN
jgi:hypothetical protein